MGFDDIDKLKQPPGRLNLHRVGNIEIGSLLIHIQQTLSLNNRCILEMVTNKEHKCIHMTDTIQKRIHIFAEKYITDEFREMHHESDEEWNDRLCHIIMHIKHPAKLQMIQCEECINKWLSSNIW